MENQREDLIDSRAQTCFSLGDELNNEPTWFWWDNSQAACASAIRTSGVAFNQCCFGWSDLVYLPASTHKRFRSMAWAFQGVFHEVALPTILHALAYDGVAMLAFVDCTGGCCWDLEWLSVGGALCHHRVMLEQDADAREHLPCAGGKGDDYFRASEAQAAPQAQSGGGSCDTNGACVGLGCPDGYNVAVVAETCNCVCFPAPMASESERPLSSLALLSTNQSGVRVMPSQAYLRVAAMAPGAAGMLYSR